MSSRSQIDFTGDGVSSVQIATVEQLPDTGSAVTITGTVTPPGGPAVTITGSPVTLPTAPVSGIINAIIQVNTSTGVATVKQNTTSGVMPVPDAGNVLVFQTTIATTDTNLELDVNSITPDTY